ncbi:MAG TPA: glycosyltransferase family 2 protein [Dehalococcoidia bacterium]|nr:glycosyltransferase family 2 protein [Dehalococcoidia bacterium]
MSIPAFNEEKLIANTITTLPDFVDMAVVVDDASTDRTSEVVLGLKDPRVILERNDENQGIGYTVIRGYKRLIAEGIEIVCLMAGDAQCDPAYLHTLIDPVLDGECDYGKANRFFHREALKQMPTFRRVGNILMSIVTKFATGYYSISDSQNSYSAIRAETLRRVDLDDISPRYEFENSSLLHYSLTNVRIKDIPVPAVYGEEESTIRMTSFLRRAFWVMIKGFFRRIFEKYVLYSFHPIALFLFSGTVLSLWGIGFGTWVAIDSLGQNTATTGTVMLAVLPFLMGFQLLLSAIVLDIQNEPK